MLQPATAQDQYILVTYSCTHYALLTSDADYSSPSIFSAMFTEFSKDASTDLFTHPIHAHISFPDTCLVCKDFDAVRAWAKARQMPEELPPDIWEAPAGDVYVWESEP